jgi:hypothetical protein
LQVWSKRQKLRDVIEEDDDLLQYGTRVEVRQRFDGRWARGFLVEKASEAGYVVRRDHDGVVLPEVFPADEVRIERRRRNMWWM